MICQLAQHLVQRVDHFTLLLIAHQALNPKDYSQAYAACDLRDSMHVVAG